MSVRWADTTTWGEVITAPSMRYAFSGSTTLNGQDRVRAERLIAKLANGTSFATGAAPGLDTFACTEAQYHHPQAGHTVYVPSGAHNGVVVLWAREMGLEVVNVPEGKHPYRPRNAMLVDHVDAALTGVPGVLLAFPEGPYARYRRSGTWMTVHMSEKRGVPVLVFDLGDPEWTALAT